ncbi:hypothetical protein TrRE_jg7535 [Triparma retinervis]|uniref:Fungal lipase-type domain-containing protein n=1 Tax=Triparma retinervis TaxID=2557542 RepID=A0A9W7AH40_9STRA|nr:hypothetical protein TrRE_jg7535 [Triparma retinervis]
MLPVMSYFNPKRAKKEEEVKEETSSPPESQFTSHRRSTSIEEEDVPPRYEVSKLDEVNKSIIPFRYEFMSPSEISAVFIATAVSSAIAIAVLIVSIVVKGDRTTDEIFRILDTLATINIVWAILIVSVMGAATFFSFRRFNATILDLTYRQKMIVRQILAGLVLSLGWGVGSMIQSISILSSSCPLFNLLDISLALWDNLMGEALLFIFHWAAIDHIISKDNPNELLSEASRGLIYIPSVLVVGLEAALRVAVSVEYLILENPYTNSATRSQGCSDVNQGTFVCAITPSMSTYNTLRLSLFIVQTLSILLIIFYCVVAWKRLAKQSWHSHRNLNVSLRLFIWNTIVIGVVYYSIRIVQFTTSRDGGGSSNPCTFLLVEMTASPETFQLFGVWMLSRSFLFTPVPKIMRDRPYYKMRITFLQTFAWGGGGGGAIKTDSEAFWTQVVGDEKIKNTRKERASLLRTMHTKGMSMSTRFGGLFNEKAWRGMIEEGDFSHFTTEGREVREDPLMRFVFYGPKPQVVQTQPVFNFEIMLKSLWLSKMVYGDGVEPDEKVESNEVAPVGFREKFDDNFERGLHTGVATGNLALAPLRIGRRKSAGVDVMGGVGGDDGEEQEGDDDEDLEEGGEPTSGFEKACEITHKSLGLTNHYVFENDDHAVRCVVFHNVEEKKIVIAFRGSKAGANFLADAKFIRKQHNTMMAPGKTALGRWWWKPMVHRGFLDSFVASGIEVAVLRRVEWLVEVMRAGGNGEGEGEGQGEGQGLSVLVCGHSLGGALAQLCAFSVASKFDLRPDEISCYTFGCPGLANIATCRQIERRVPATFNIINNTDWVYYVGKYASRVYHPGIPVQINRNGDLLVRPTFVESSLSHLWWRESITDHLFPSYQRSIAAIIKKHPECADVTFAINACPTLIDYVNTGSLPDASRRVFEQNLNLAKGRRKSVTVTRRRRRKKKEKVVAKT